MSLPKIGYSWHIVQVIMDQYFGILIVDHSTLMQLLGVLDYVGFGDFRLIRIVQ
jgi:hypothetical protein